MHHAPTSVLIVLAVHIYTMNGITSNQKFTTGLSDVCTAGNTSDSICSSVSSGDSVLVNPDTLGSVSGDVQQLVDCAAAGGKLVFNLTEIRLPGMLVISQPLTIKTFESGAETVVLCSNGEGAFTVR